MMCGPVLLLIIGVVLCSLLVVCGGFDVARCCLASCVVGCCLLLWRAGSCIYIVVLCVCCRGLFVDCCYVWVCVVCCWLLRLLCVVGGVSVVCWLLWFFAVVRCCCC